MAIINLDVEKILSISNELNSLDTTLLNSYVPEIKDIINQIKSNVLNDQVNSILGTIASQVDSISGELSVDLPKLEQFLETQMQSYQATEAEAQAKLQAVVNTMGGFAGVQPVNIDGGNGAAPADGGAAQPADGGQGANGQSVWSNANQDFLSDQGALWSEYGKSVSNAWKNVGESTGLIDGVINVADATITTVLDTAGAAVSTVVDGAEWVIDQGVEVVDNVVDAILPPWSW